MPILSNSKHEYPSVEEKLAALRELGRMMRMFDEVDEPESLKRIGELGHETMLACLIVLVDERQAAAQKTACAYLLDYVRPGWRRGAQEEILAPLVQRGSVEVFMWRRMVLDRDGRICVECGSDQELEAHHIARWVDAPHLRLSISNGKTLCRACHLRAHGRVAH